MRISKWILTIIFLAIIVVGVVFLFYINDYYPASDSAVQISQEMLEDEDGDLYFRGESTRGFIIYPGNRVDIRAYAELARSLNFSGDEVVIARAPYRLVFLDDNLADRIIAKNKEIEEWYIVGIDQGGYAASRYLATSPQKVEGVIFLGSEPRANLEKMDIRSLTIVGDRDELVDRMKIESNDYYPRDSSVVLLTGGNHSYFGDYGLLNGDMPALISPGEQQRQTAREILDWVGS